MSLLTTLMGTMVPQDAAEAGSGAAQAAGNDAAAQEAKRLLDQYIAMGEMPEDTGGSYWMPEYASVTADNVDWLYYGLLGLSLFCFVGITAAVIYFVVKYRARTEHDIPEPSPSHNNPLEITWTIIPALICVFLFLFGWRGYIDMATPPKHALEVQVTGKKWNWSFVHPDGVKDSTGALHVPINRSVRLLMISDDVLHSFFIPAFRTKQDVVPRRYTQLWFKATKPGVYRVFCAEYCGREHSLMKTTVVVHEPGGYEQYIRDMIDINDNEPPLDRGKRIFGQVCIACHTVDGSPKVGPTFKGIWGAEHDMDGGDKVTVDENYIRESVYEPQAKIRKGFAAAGAMPSFKGQLNDKDIAGLITYLKFLKE